MAQATIRDVAKQAQVSVATVSRVLNNSALVSEETRQRVLNVFRELDYSPNPAARRLSLKRTHTVAVILPFITLPSFVERLRGVQYVLATSEYDLVLFSVDTSAQRDEYFANLPRRTRVDGLLIISLPLSDQDAERFLLSGVPTVLVDVWHPDLSKVYVDDEAGGYLATQHLLSLGHRRIAFLSDCLESPLGFLAMKQRYAGYRRALLEMGLPFEPAYHQQGEHGRGEARQMAHALLDLPTPPTAIFAASDTQAIGVLDAAQERGLRIPAQLSVIGYDGIRDAEYLHLTTVEQPLFASGEQGAQILLKMLRGEIPSETPEDLPLPVQLVRRQTTAPPLP